MLTELYLFTEDSVQWAYTNVDTEVTYNSVTYTPLAIGRSNVGQKNELSKANLDVKVPLSSDIGARWIQGELERTVSLTVYQQTDAGTSVIWKGRLAHPKASSDHITLRFESIFTSLERAGLRRHYQRHCPYMLYGRGCRLDRANYASFGILTNIVDDVATVNIASLQADGYYKGGILETLDGNTRFILEHSGNDLTLIRVMKELNQAYADSGNQAVIIYPGCDRTIDTCNTRFSNIANYGGFPHIPAKNPELARF